MKVISVEYLKCTMKFSLWEIGNNDALAFGSFDGIGSDNCIYNIIYKNEKISENVVLNNYDDIVSYLISIAAGDLKLVDPKNDIALEEGESFPSPDSMITDVVNDLRGAAIVTIGRLSEHHHYIVEMPLVVSFQSYLL